MEYNIISADDHIDLRFMPKDVWTSRFPEKFKERAPHVEELDQGPTWVFDGQINGPWGLFKANPGSLVKWAIERGGALNEGPLRPTTPTLRLADMDRDGVDASVLYGPPERFLIDDPSMRGACFSTYNDWLIEFCAQAPDRFIGAAQLDYEDPEFSANELERVVDLGLRHANVLAPVASPPWYEPEWERFWSVAEEVDIPIASHLIAAVRRETPPANGTAGALQDSATTKAAISVTGKPPLAEPFAGLVISGVFDRHPKLRVVMAESGLAWVPNLMERLDFWYGRQKPDERPKRTPSEYFADHIWMTFQEDEWGAKMIPILPDGKVMWASDYPHPRSTWPESQEIIAKQISGFPEELQRKVVVENAQQLYGIGV